MAQTLDHLCINTIRTLSMDAIQKAKSGHPGLPMGTAAIAYTMWTRHLRHNPSNPSWANRDRFVLSGGHGSMLLYSLLHLCGYDLSMDDLRQFRQWGSKTPGHPEYGHTAGVEMTTGPLGQGFATGVGMAIAQKNLAARFNRPGHDVVDYRIYAIVTDGDLMEGVASEAASLAGHLQLGNLVYVYDDNRISIDGSTDIAFTEDRGKRFEAYGWHVQYVADGNDVDAIDQALAAAERETARPSIIIARTHIGYGSPNKQDTHEAHGAPLGDEEIRLTKQAYGWDPDKQFYVPAEALAHYRQCVDRGRQWELAWIQAYGAYQKAYPDLAAELQSIRTGSYGDAWRNALPVFTDPMATREASGKVLNAIAPHLPGLLGGSADLAPSNNTFVKSLGEFQPGTYAGRYFRFGVREHAMGALLNGMALTDALIPYGGTFMIFSEYMRPAIRLAALMGIRAIYVFTHDSIGLGEDGPTHQPIEQFASLRAIPNLVTLRPADGNETVAAWKFAVEHRTGPVALALTRQKLPSYDRTKYASADNLSRGAYVMAETNKTPDLILIGTGSEMQFVAGAYETLAAEGINVRLVSMPSWELFEQQPKEYRDQVFPPACTKRIAVEAGVSLGWHRYVGDQGLILGINRYGVSAPYERIFKEFGFTVENVVRLSRQLL